MWQTIHWFYKFNEITHEVMMSVDKCYYENN